MSHAEVTSQSAHQTPEEAAAPQPQEAKATEAFNAKTHPGLNSIIDDFTREQSRIRSECHRITPDSDESLKAAVRQFHIDTLKSRRSKLEVLLDNIGNPVVLGNAVLAAVLSAGLGFEAYQRQMQGHLSWNIIGLGAGLVGVTAGVDYFISKWLLRNKYPTN